MNNSRYLLLSVYGPSGQRTDHLAVLVKAAPEYLETLLSLEDKLKKPIGGLDIHCLQLWDDTPSLIDLSGSSGKSPGSDDEKFLELLRSHLNSKDILEIDERLFQRLAKMKGRLRTLSSSLLLVSGIGISWTMAVKSSSSNVLDSSIIAFEELNLKQFSQRLTESVP